MSDLLWGIREGGRRWYGHEVGDKGGVVRVEVGDKGGRKEVVRVEVGDKRTLTFFVCS